MNVCVCGHSHCCHVNHLILERKINAVNEFGIKYSFIRRACICGQWMGDKEIIILS